MYYFGKSEEYMDLSRIYLAVHRRMNMTNMTLDKGSKR